LDQGRFLEALSFSEEWAMSAYCLAVAGTGRWRLERWSSRTDALYTTHTTHTCAARAREPTRDAKAKANVVFWSCLFRGGSCMSQHGARLGMCVCCMLCRVRRLARRHCGLPVLVAGG
jgi:hypothetical protein